MTAHLVFVHGWGFDAASWRAVQDELADFACETVDLGFFGCPATSRANGAEPVVAIGHSLGFLWLLHERPFAWRGLVSIAGMPRFTKAADYDRAVGERVLDAMIRRFAGSPDETLSDFIRRAGCTRADNGKRIDPARLGEALHWLKDWDARDALSSERSPVLALFAEDDEIVPKAMSEDIFACRRNTRLATRAHGGHALPMTEPRWCAAQIREFVQCL